MIKPLADRVLIEAKEAETKTASGLIIPDTAKEKPQQGTVRKNVEFGLKNRHLPKEEIRDLTAKIHHTILTGPVSVGDEVLYGKYAGTEITVDGKKYLIMRQSDVVAIVK